MSASDFIAYVGDVDIHDGHVQTVTPGEGVVDVRIKGASGCEFTIRFVEVKSVKSNRPEGMMVYALVERGQPGPLRRFDFANWDDDDEAYLEIVARGIEIVPAN